MDHRTSAVDGEALVGPPHVVVLPRGCAPGHSDRPARQTRDISVSRTGELCGQCPGVLDDRRGRGSGSRRRLRRVRSRPVGDRIGPVGRERQPGSGADHHSGQDDRAGAQHRSASQPPTSTCRSRSLGRTARPGSPPHTGAQETPRPNSSLRMMRRKGAERPQPRHGRARSGPPRRRLLPRSVPVLSPARRPFLVPPRVPITAPATVAGFSAEPIPVVVPCRFARPEPPAGQRGINGYRGEVRSVRPGPRPGARPRDVGVGEGLLAGVDATTQGALLIVEHRVHPGAVRVPIRELLARPQPPQVPQHHAPVGAATEALPRRCTENPPPLVHLVDQGIELVAHVSDRFALRRGRGPRLGRAPPTTATESRSALADVAVVLDGEDRGDGPEAGHLLEGREQLHLRAGLESPGGGEAVHGHRGAAVPAVDQLFEHVLRAPQPLARILRLGAVLPAPIVRRTGPALGFSEKSATPRATAERCRSPRESCVVEVVHGQSQPHRRRGPSWSSTTHWSQRE